MSRAARIGILCVSAAIFCYAAIGYRLLGRTTDDKAYKSLTVYGEVLHKIQQDYVDDPNMHTVTAGAPMDVCNRSPPKRAICRRANTKNTKRRWPTPAPAKRE